MAVKRTKEAPMKVQLPLYMSAELKQIVEQEAQAANMSLTGYIVWAIAEKVNRLDLAFVPRKRSDSPPTEHVNGHKKEFAKT
jgi:hypothetical protein